MQLFCLFFKYFAFSGGHNLANFLVDSGWYMAAETVLVATKDIDESLLQQTDELSHYNHCQVSIYPKFSKSIHKCVHSLVYRF